ncbi:MAG: hypothetical protein ACYCST_21880 [Acidimicrobiales bacterium]
MLLTGALLTTVSRRLQSASNCWLTSASGMSFTTVVRNTRAASAIPLFVAAALLYWVAARRAQCAGDARDDGGSERQKTRYERASPNLAEARCAGDGREHGC